MPAPPLRPIPNSYWVLPGRFLAGEYPGSLLPAETVRRINAFLRAGFDTFVNLTGENELPPYNSILSEQAAELGFPVRHIRLAVEDFDIPTPTHMRLILETIDTALAAGRKVYLHCWGGVGRTGTAVGCYLVQHGMSGQQALRQLNEWWQGVPKSVQFPRSPETGQQEQFILQWKP